jgi:hypothetical protein
VSEFQDQTILHPLGGAMLLASVAMMLFGGRRSALLGLLVLVMFVSSAQRVAVGALDFHLLRLAALGGFARILLQREYQQVQPMFLDAAVCMHAVLVTMIHVMLHGSVAALIFRFGTMFDAIGVYVLLRCLIRSQEDVRWCLAIVAWLTLPVAVAFGLEWMTQRNIFAVFGGVPEITMVREGRLRCQGAFPHPIIAGCVFACLAPLLATRLWDQTASRVLTIGSLAACGWIVLCTASATPLTGFMAGVGAWMLILLRRYLSVLRWMALGAVVMLHVVMQAPVWSLLARIDLVGGSTGRHRFLLIDAAVTHMGDWFLLGTRSTEHWGHYLTDITNHYVLEAIRGGALGLAAFIAIIVMCFSNIGRALRAAHDERRATMLAWGLGASISAHCVMFLGVSYFGQVMFFWTLGLAISATLVAPAAAVRHVARARVHSASPTRSVSVGLPYGVVR